ncbi:MAG: large-conductance mechanosensitive channel protein [Chloroflexi bacterium UTCFX4]|jgi:large conductance mechanosensitive channel|nr:MAG: large-conductance mechanosensitive channel protein [Chloroflexi bacterium UTCFX4]
MLKEFRDFIMRGNVIDLAVAVIMGAAFTAIVNSLVQDILMPILGLLTGGVDFNSLYINLSGKTFATYAEAKAAGAAVIGYGAFIQATITFLLIALSVFFMIKAVNAANRKQTEAPAPPAPTKEETLLAEIRDLLAKQNK